jgi:SAM-dependent methyltransferase
MSFHDRTIGALLAYGRFGSKFAGTFDRLRERIVPLAEGVVFELGVGAGLNLVHYDRSRVARLVGVNPAESPADLARINRDAAGLDMELVRSPVTALPFADASADSVVVTYGFCASPDAEAAMREARRVLKPSGRLLIAELGRAQSGRIASLQDRLNPLWRALAFGRNLNRDISAMLARAGFDTDTVEQVYLRGLPRALGAHHMGVARPI